MLGPLAGIRVVEIAGLVAAPFCGMLLADLGADVIRIDRPNSANAPSAGPPPAITGRSRRAIELDLKSPAGVSVLLDLLERGDAFFESFRPGVAERLGFGPDECLRRNPRLVYGRLTGWGQDGRLALNAGHDINYTALTGVLSLMGQPGITPQPPLNLVGDMAGGGLMLAFGIVSALLHAQRTGEGQVVDTAMIDGAALLMATAREYVAAGTPPERGQIPSDGGHPFYSVYRCGDGRYISIGCMEPQFSAELFRLLALDPNDFSGADDPAHWQELRARLEPVFGAKGLEDWRALMEDNAQLCFAPVLDMNEAARHPHNVDREGYFELDGVVQPAPAPRFSRTPTPRPKATRKPDRDTRFAVLSEWLGYGEEDVAGAARNGAFGKPA